MVESLSIALKEWDLLIRSMMSGEQAILLRKGGILEANNEFELEQKRFLFYPTFIHQDPRMVKTERRGEIRALPAEPSTIEIAGYGEVAKIMEILPDAESAAGGKGVARQRVNRLSDLHLWDSPLIDMRFAYRPDKPLYVAVIRAFKLPNPVTIAHTLGYAGCKSWVPLEESIDVRGAVQVLPEEMVQAIVLRVRQP